MPGTLLGMFAKYWQPGEVKTRLAAAVGPDEAARLYRVFVETLLARMTGVAERSVLAYSPPGRHDEFAELVRASCSARSPWLVQPQSLGDLGARMNHFFRASFARGAERVVLIGSDSPTLPREFVQRAFDELRGCEVVLGPSDDGGYYLIGMARSVGSAVRTTHPHEDGHAAPGPHSGPYGLLSSVFEGVPWSTPQVWPQTIARLDRQGCSYAVLPPWYDVDQPADLDRLRDELRGTAADETLRSLRQTLGAVLGG